MSKPFKLSCTLLGHSLDVRSVCATNDDSIISGSRDTTTKFWKANGFNTGYTDVMTYRDQQKFVASVLYLDPSPTHPDGVVVTGGNDNLILVYLPGEPFARLKLKEHTNTVCRLTKGLRPNSFLSASWDTTAKYWVLGQSEKSFVTFSGHSAAVWGVVQLNNGNVATASADKTIGIWHPDGKSITKLHGHTDCVRDILDLSDINCFVSVSNDASIKVWTYTAENINTYYGHANFIYSIAKNSAGGPNCFVTSDEDRTVRYWKNGENTESIILPAQSVWSVACLGNGDIVTGSSDGIVRVFTQEEGRYASPETLKMYDEQVEALNKQACQEIGGYKVSDLPGKEALYDPGKKAGQMKMIREPQGVVAYTWVEDGENSHWEKVGDVLGGTDKNSEGKTMFEGQSYDYVFSVDVEDGKPPLKLPFNKGDDPYVAAHNFLEKNFLPAAYLDQVVDFILKNSQEAATLQTGNSDYVDPFTGSSRYTPSASNTNEGYSGQNVDPFTGGSSYSTSATRPPAQTPAAPTPGANVDPFTGQSSYSTINSQNNQLFPIATYRTFDMGDPKIIISKLKEFNIKAQTSGKDLDEASIEKAVNACISPSDDKKSLDLISKLLSWPDDIIFPVLDALRLGVKDPSVNSEISTKTGGLLMEKLKQFTNQNCTVPNNTLVALRLLCNLLMHEDGEELVFKSRVDLLDNVSSLQPANKNSQVALSTFLLNTVILCLKRKDDIGISILIGLIPEVTVNVLDPEAQFRLLVAIGTLISSDSHRKVVQEKLSRNVSFIKVLESANNYSSTEVELKRKNCAASLGAILFG